MCGFVCERRGTFVCYAQFEAERVIGMVELPKWLDKALLSIGVNTTRLKWKLHYWREGWRKMNAPKDASGQKYKYCRCGQMALAADTECGACGRRLPSYTMWKLANTLTMGNANAPVASITFISVFVFLFLWQAFLTGGASIGMSDSPADIQRFRLTQISFGMLIPDLMRITGEYWQILTMALAHGGLMHLLFNGIALAQVMTLFEREIGPWTTILVMTVTQLCAAGAHLAFSGYPALGASGIAYGYIGMGITFANSRGDSQLRQFFIQWFIYGMIFAVMMPRIAHAAHLGGFFAGLILGHFLGKPFVSKEFRVAMGVSGGVCLLLWAVAFVWMMIKIFRTLPDILAIG